MLGTQTKTPADVLDYDISYSDWIAAGDTITSVVTTVEPANQLAIDSAQISGTNVKVWVSGGADGVSYNVDVTVSTSQGRIKKEAFKMRIKDV